MFNLTDLGWNNFFDELFNSNTNNKSFIPGRIAVENKHRYTVYSQYGELSAEVSGKLLFSADSNSELPKVGDWVLLNYFPDEQKGIIQEVLKRNTVFSRKSAGIEVKEQIIAVNIDTLFIVQSLDNNFNLRRLERYLVMAKSGGIKPFVVLSKSDLCNSVEDKITQVKNTIPGIEVIAISVLDNRGIDEFIKLIKPNNTYAFVGSSGTGKSTIINKLLGEEIQTTNEVRQKDSRGKHTTTARELFVLPTGGVLIDTPGMREFHLWLTDDSIGNVFDEIDIIAQDCRFKDCKHINEKGCAVLEALETGTISKERYNNYLKLNKEQEYLNSKSDINAFLNKKEKWKNLSKFQKQYKKYQVKF